MTKIQEILEIGLEEYLEKNKTVGYKQKVIKAIKNCKSDKLGAHKYVCDECGHEEIAYNSCRNRHCPNCQTGKKLKWIEARKEEVLNIKYYHVVFTIPSEIYNIAIQNQSKIYKIMFKASAETLQELAEDEKYLGGEIGFFSILHTWGQNLMYHPHIHCVVTGGGLTELGKWVEKEEDFFIPVKVMSRKFRGKFLKYMKETKFDFYGKNKELENPAIYNELINQMYIFLNIVLHYLHFQMALYNILSILYYTSGLLAHYILLDFLTLYFFHKSQLLFLLDSLKTFL